MASWNLTSSIFILLAFLASSSNSVGMNVIDRCWRSNKNWAADRAQLAKCSVGFAGKMRRNRGHHLTWYSVTDPSDDPANPRYGTLRYGATLLKGKTWITFQRDMQIKLEKPLLIKSFTTIDGRGADVHIANGASFLLYEVSDVIIHGLHFHDCKAQTHGLVVAPGGAVRQLGLYDGDALRLVGASKVWIDHYTFSHSQDGLLDVTRGSTSVTISNNWFKDHDKVMLLGHDDSFAGDRKMKITLAFNRFGPKCNQRMPRFGYAHVVNNLYEEWGSYAIGGSMDPTVLSEANLYIAPQFGRKKLTSRIEGISNSWNWISVNDAFENGAYFKQSGRNSASPNYNQYQAFDAANANEVREMTRTAGALSCSTALSC